ncbi:MAG: ATP-binding protein [Planctomycetes bacterium]|nr:ATP-binding protein [Planctomycetota bacterium]
MKRTIEDYFPDANPKLHDIFTGYDMYMTLKRMRHGEPQESAMIHEFEHYLSTTFYEGNQVSLIPYEAKSGEGDRHDIRVKIGNGSQRSIHNLGDGMQSLLTCLFPIFMADEKDRCLFFIEEPDICMHPSLQRAFIEALRDPRHRRHQYFITTHSNHLLDLTQEFTNISIFHFQKTQEGPAKFRIRNVSHGDHSILRDLGVRSSSVFLANSTIWVEGITDRLYLRKFMERYLESLKLSNHEQYEKYSRFREDYHYAFVEYQGSNLVHWTFDLTDDNCKKIKAHFLCASAIVFADGDIAGKGTRTDDFRKQLGDRFIILDCKEIENLLPEESIRTYITFKGKDSKGSAASILRSEYCNVSNFVGLGKYLDEKLNLSPNTLATDSGTIRNKIDFCNEIIQLWDDNPNWKLPGDVGTCMARLFAHIDRQNPK